MKKFFQKNYLKGKVKSFRQIVKNIKVLPDQFKELSDRLASIEQNLSNMEQSREAANGRQLKALEQSLPEKIEHHLPEEIKHDLSEKPGGIHQQLHNIKQVANLIAARQPVIGRKIKVVFLVHHIEAWDSIADIYQSMLEAEDFEPVVATINRRFPGESSYGFEPVVHERLKGMGVKHIRLGMEDSWQGLDIVKAIAPDIIFRQSPWEADVPPAFHTDELRFARLCYIPYGVLSMLKTAELIDGWDIAADSYWHRSCWRIFYAVEQGIKYMMDHSTRKGGNVLRTGHPKVNRLIREGERNSHWPLQNHGNTNSTKIIWSPHHSVEDNWNRFGMFHLMYKDMLEWARSALDKEIVLSAHPALFSKVTEEGSFLTATELEAFLAEWDALPNTGRIAAGNYAGVMQASDYLVSDGISFLMEYQFFNKPVIFLERPDHIAFSKSGEKIIEGVHRVPDIEAAKALIARFEAGEADPLAQKQKDNVAWLNAQGDAVENIITAIRQGIVAEQA